MTKFKIGDTVRYTHPRNVCLNIYKGNRGIIKYIEKRYTGLSYIFEGGSHIEVNDADNPDSEFALTLVKREVKPEEKEIVEPTIRPKLDIPF